jgi:hypothetical protein
MAVARVVGVVRVVTVEHATVETGGIGRGVGNGGGARFDLVRAVAKPELSIVSFSFFVRFCRLLFLRVCWLFLVLCHHRRCLAGSIRRGGCFSRFRRLIQTTPPIVIIP